MGGLGVYRHLTQGGLPRKASGQLFLGPGFGFGGAKKRLLLPDAPCTVSRSAWEGVEGEGGKGGLGVYRHLTRGKLSTQGLGSVRQGL